MNDPRYGMQESPTTVKHLIIVNALGVLVALSFYLYKLARQPAEFSQTLANSSIESNILGACFYAVLFILSLMTGKIIVRGASAISIKQSKWVVTGAQAVLSGLMMVHLSLFVYLELSR